MNQESVELEKEVDGLIKPEPLPIDKRGPTKKETEELEALKIMVQLAQNIFITRSVSPEAAMNLSKDFIMLTNKRFNDTEYAHRLAALAKAEVQETK